MRDIVSQPVAIGIDAALKQRHLADRFARPDVADELGMPILPCFERPQRS